jgi:hypothetical protein
MKRSREPRLDADWLARKKLTSDGRILVLLVAALCVCGYIFTPIGLETRSLSTLRVPILPVFFLTPVILSFVALVLMFYRPRTAAALASVAASIFIFFAPGDQGGYFFTVPVPAAISVNELVVLFISIGALIYGPKVYRENAKSTPAIVP